MSCRCLHKLLFAVLLTTFALPVAAVEMIPCAVGNKWQYETVKQTHASIKFQDQALATLNRPLAGSSTYEITAVDKDNPLLYEYVEAGSYQSSDGDIDEHKSTLRMLSDDKSLRILSTNRESFDENEPEKQTYDPPLFYFSKDAVPGKAWSVGTMLDGDTKTVVNARAADKETVTVPAGTFKDCLKIVYSSDDISGTIEVFKKSFNITSGRSRGIYWIADGVGVVKELEISNAVAESPGPGGQPFILEAATCVVSELKAGYTVQKADGSRK